MIQLACSCPILHGYRTNGVAFLLRLSDSSRLSDKRHRFFVALVRFFAVIGQTVLQTHCGCPILRNGHFCLFIYVRADESDKDRHQQYDRE